MLVVSRSQEEPIDSNLSTDTCDLFHSTDFHSGQYALMLHNQIDVHSGRGRGGGIVQHAQADHPKCI